MLRVIALTACAFVKLVSIYVNIYWELNFFKWKKVEQVAF